MILFSVFAFGDKQMRSPAHRWNEICLAAAAIRIRTVEQDLGTVRRPSGQFGVPGQVS